MAPRSLQTLGGCRGFGGLHRVRVKLLGAWLPFSREGESCAPEHYDYFTTKAKPPARGACCVHTVVLPVSGCDRGRTLPLSIGISRHGAAVGANDIVPERYRAG